VEFPLAGLRWNIYPWWLHQNVQDLDLGQLELFLRCLNVKYARRLQNFTNASHSRMSAMFVFQNPVRSLARPNFLTGAIIETRFQASLLTPLPHPHPRLNEIYKRTDQWRHWHVLCCIGISKIECPFMTLESVITDLLKISGSAALFCQMHVLYSFEMESSSFWRYILFTILFSQLLTAFQLHREEQLICCGGGGRFQRARIHQIKEKKITACEPYKG